MLTNRSRASWVSSSLSGDSNRYDAIYVSNYAQRNVVEELQRVPGVGSASLFSAQYYAMRIWLDPQRLNALGLTPTDVAQALREQNAELPAGSIGAEPLKKPVDFTFTMTTKGRLFTPEEFERIVVHRDAAGGVVRIKDVARVELGAESYGLHATLNGKAAVPLGLFLQPGANSLDAMDGVRKAMVQISKNFPAGLHYQIPFDSTDFVRISIKEVAETLLIAFVLVFAIVYLFLGNWRATLIPSLAVPVSLIGAFAGMYALGFSINTLTLFGMVLAIGIVVDDAIVVLENVERIMHEEHVDAATATEKTMEQVTGPVIAIVLVLAAVFVPVAFLGGLSGVMYKQFAITIAVSVAISGFVALTLTPALCASLLRAEDKEEFEFLRRFGAWFASPHRPLCRRGRQDPASRLSSPAWLIAVGVASLVAAPFRPGRPRARRGSGLHDVGRRSCPTRASLSRTDAVVKQLDDYAVSNDDLQGQREPHWLRLSVGRACDRAAPSSSTYSRTGRSAVTPRRARGRRSGAPMYGAASINDARVLAFNPPPIFGLSTTGGFDFYIQSRANSDYKQLAGVVGQLIGRAFKRSEAHERVHRIQREHAADPPRDQPRQGRGDGREPRRTFSKRRSRRSGASTSTTSIARAGRFTC